MDYPSEQELTSYFSAISQETHFISSKVKDQEIDAIKSVRVGSFCREVVIHDLEYVMPRKSETDLTELRASGITALGINPGEKPKLSSAQLIRMQHVADIMVAIPHLLLSPDRYQGDWWQKPMRFGRIAWNAFGYDNRLTGYKYYGIDNNFLTSAGLVSLYLGLYRQAYWLAIAPGVSPTKKKINKKDINAACGLLLRQVPRGEVIRILDECDVKAAKRLIHQLQPWFLPKQGMRKGRMGQVIPFITQKHWDGFWQLHEMIYNPNDRKVVNINKLTGSGYCKLISGKTKKLQNFTSGV